MGKDKEPYANIVGIFSIGPNAAACLVQEGHLVAMAEEERFLRVKDHELVLPDRALEYCLKEGGIGLQDVDAIAYGWNAPLYRWRMPLGEVGRWLADNGWPEIVGTPLQEHIYRALLGSAEMILHHPAVVRQRLAARWQDLTLPPLHFVPHHLAHAAGTYYCSGLERANVLTMDRNGEDKCTVLWHGEGLNLEVLQEYRLPHSLGWYYSGFTEFLGFRPQYHEGKTMGLAAYGRPDEQIAASMAKVLRLDSDGAYAVDPTYFYCGQGRGDAFSEKLVRLFGPPRRGPGQNIDQHYKDIAFAVQARLEEAVLRLVKLLTERTGLRDLCLAGGVALNCVANGKVLCSGLVDRLYVSPVSNDAGSALGAALWLSAQHGYDPRGRMEHAYWGPGYGDDEICATLDRLGLKYERHEAIEEVVARHLTEGRAVAWFQGRMEIGPRALGARSLLGDPRDAAMRDRLNRIKGREAWRPLAPAILAEAVSEYCEAEAASPFMAIACRVRPEKRGVIPAVVHSDGTTRPQSVGPQALPRYRRLIEAFRELTGVPAVINTSFNVQGEPLVCSVADAVRSYYGSEIDELAIGPALLRKV
jgi:carbamoyltransferase